MGEQRLRFFAGFRDNPSKALLFFIGASVAFRMTQCFLRQGIPGLDSPCILRFSASLPLCGCCPPVSPVGVAWAGTCSASTGEGVRSEWKGFL